MPNPSIDALTSALRTITTDHAYIHTGILFESFAHFTLAAGATRYLTIITPATAYLHYRNEKVSCSADKLLIQLFEGSTVTVAGDLLVAINHHRISATAATAVLHDNATVTVDGTKISEAYIGGGTGVGGSRSGGDTTSQNEYVLKRSTTYSIKLTNGSSTNNIVQINPLWYEEAGA